MDLHPVKVRYLLTLEYIGTNFIGWQRQNTGRTVQQVLEEAIKGFLGEPVLIHGSSRTDAGVHALGNTAHLDICRSSKRKPGKELPPHEPSAVLKAINHFLRKAGTLDVSVRGVHRIPGNVHARYAATSRVYHYRILSGPLQASAFEQGRVWHVHEELDEDAMRRAASLLLGRHDFSSFRAVGCQARDPTRTIDELSVSVVDHWPHFCPPRRAPRPAENGDDRLVKSDPRDADDAVLKSGSVRDAAKGELREADHGDNGLVKSDPREPDDALMESGLRREAAKGDGGAFLKCESRGAPNGGDDVPVNIRSREADGASIDSVVREGERASKSSLRTSEAPEAMKPCDMLSKSKREVLREAGDALTESISREAEVATDGHFRREIMESKRVYDVLVGSETAKAEDGDGALTQRLSREDDKADGGLLTSEMREGGVQGGQGQVDDVRRWKMRDAGLGGGEVSNLGGGEVSNLGGGEVSAAHSLGVAMNHRCNGTTSTEGESVGDDLPSLGADGRTGVKCEGSAACALSGAQAAVEPSACERGARFGAGEGSDGQAPWKRVKLENGVALPVRAVGARVEPDRHASLPDGNGTGGGPRQRPMGMGAVLPSFVESYREVVVTVKARSFLYHQVRLMVAVLKAVGCGKLAVDDVRKILEARNNLEIARHKVAMAPACGLYLAQVNYDDSEVLPVEGQENSLDYLDE